MEYKIGDLVAAEQWTIHGREHSLGMVVDRNTYNWKVEWFGFQVEFPWYSLDNMKIFRDNYFALRQKLNI